mmetsp:Transcript_32890/g.65532  ORF Transcript_32890/g.65532 Transcript_32890/m.65532 type:complete len:373 (-) Transcript_32890:357-1475(-)
MGNATQHTETPRTNPASTAPSTALKRRRARAPHQRRYSTTPYICLQGASSPLTKEPLLRAAARPRGRPAGLRVPDRARGDAALQEEAPELLQALHHPGGVARGHHVVGPLPLRRRCSPGPDGLQEIAAVRDLAPHLRLPSKHQGLLRAPPLGHPFQQVHVVESLPRRVQIVEVVLFAHRPNGAVPVACGVHHRLPRQPRVDYRGLVERRPEVRPHLLPAHRDPAQVQRHLVHLVHEVAVHLVRAREPLLRHPRLHRGRKLPTRHVGAHDVSSQVEEPVRGHTGELAQHRLDRVEGSGLARVGVWDRGQRAVSPASAPFGVAAEFGVRKAHGTRVSRGVELHHHPHSPAGPVRHERCHVGQRVALPRRPRSLP